jgi:hypothetical protein
MDRYSPLLLGDGQIEDSPGARARGGCCGRQPSQKLESIPIGRYGLYVVAKKKEHTMAKDDEELRRAPAGPQQKKKADVRVIGLPGERLDEAASLLACGFRDDPNFVDLFPGGRARSRALPPCSQPDCATPWASVTSTPRCEVWKVPP